jgi:hypothetical protein
MRCGNLPHHVFVTRTLKHAANNVSLNLLTNSNQIPTSNILRMLLTRLLHFHKTRGIKQELFSPRPDQITNLKPMWPRRRFGKRNSLEAVDRPAAPGFYLFADERAQIIKSDFRRLLAKDKRSEKSQQQEHFISMYHLCASPTAVCLLALR